MGYVEYPKNVMPNVFVSSLSLLPIHVLQENIFCTYHRKRCDRKGKGTGPHKRDLVGKGVRWAHQD